MLYKTTSLKLKRPCTQYIDMIETQLFQLMAKMDVIKCKWIGILLILECISTSSITIGP